jgi:ABC-type uncharacterized transport system YnjBCD permease subunit
MVRRPGVLRLAPALTVGILLLPIAAGLVGTLLPAFGYLPAIGGRTFNLDGWRRLADYPGFGTSVAITIGTGVLTSALAVILAFGCCASLHDRPWMRRLGAWVAPILSTPHSAIALGLAFLLAPSGWIARALSPWLTGWILPPDVATVGDPAGVALVLGLLLKEVPYLILMIVGALNQVQARAHLAIARALGYGTRGSMAQGHSSADLSADPAADLRGDRVLAVGGRRGADSRSLQSRPRSPCSRCAGSATPISSSIFPRRRRRSCCCCS